MGLRPVLGFFGLQAQASQLVAAIASGMVPMCSANCEARQGVCVGVVFKCFALAAHGASSRHAAQHGACGWHACSSFGSMAKVRDQ